MKRPDSPFDRSPIAILLLCGLVLTLSACSSSGPVASQPGSTVIEGDVDPTSDSTPDPSTAMAEDNIAPESSEVEGGEPSDEDDAAFMPLDWYLLAPTPTTSGAAVQTAYELLGDRKPAREVIVAVIDSGVDITHEDLDDNIWTNPGEVPGNGLDDDGNGYVDDVHGWNFIGGPDGRNVEYDTFEVVRELARYRERFADTDASGVGASDKQAYEYYLELEDAYEQKVATETQIAESVRTAADALAYAQTIMAGEFGRDKFTIAEVAAYESPKPNVQQAQSILIYLDQVGITESDLVDELVQIENRIKYGLDLEYDPRAIVGDDYSNVREKVYGNADVAGPDPSHGTHVAGIIAAERNDIGIDGIASGTRIMSIRAVPNGDERDKDVANAIRYAADNGAHIVNMSFGKDYSSDPDIVWESIEYALDAGVLIVHAAGNEALDLDRIAQYPTRYGSRGEDFSSGWIEVGASDWETDALAAPFSNFGAKNVDLFAPGVRIRSTMPGNTYEPADGTSMAAPVVSGIAAMLMAYFPDLTNSDIKSILISSAESYGTQSVMAPGSEASVRFGILSSSGAIVNAANAVEKALETH